MKITQCENRFEVVLDGLVDEETASKIYKEFVKWINSKEMPSDEDYLAAMGPCGK
jgi:hypothetical protein